MSSPVKRELEDYVAGRGKPERVVITVAVAYYRDAGSGMRDALRPLIDVIDRASPGIVELGGVSGAPGFDVRLAERPFPAEYAEELRRVAEAVLGAMAAETPSPRPGLLRRVLTALQRVFSA
jgi:hypothetical protein